MSFPGGSCMAELVAVLVVLAVAVVAITVIGHGLWLMVAAIVGALFGGDGSRAGGRTGGCPRCGSLRFSRATGCPECGLDSGAGAGAGGTARRDVEELAAAKRQFDRMAEAGTIGQEEWSRLTMLIQAERTRIEGGFARPSRDRTVRAPAAASGAAGRRESEARAAPKRHDVQPVEALEISDFDEGPALARGGGNTEERREQRGPAQGAALAQGVAASAQAAGPVQAAAPVPAAPRRTVADVLQAFMEEKNIRWGEVISGMLIVISAVGLVISVWSTLAESIPYFPALLFMLVTAAIHGAGLYTLRRWKLESTSRGLLVISTLLVPLNFLAAIALSESERAPRAVGDVWYVSAVLVGLLGYGAITWSAGRAMLRRLRWPLFVAVMGASAAQLVVSRLAEPGLGLVALNQLAFLPLAPFLAATGRQLAWVADGRRLSQQRIGQTLLLLGIAVFALALPLGLLASKTGAVLPTLAAVSPCLNLAAVMVLALGLVIHVRATQPALAAVRTTGTWLALLGALVTLATVVLAWPRPDLLVAIGAIDFVGLTALAALAGLPLLHIPAVAGLGLAAVVGLHLAQGRIGVEPPPSGLELFRVLMMGRSGIVLMVLSALTSAVGAVLLREARGAAYEGGAAEGTGQAGRLHHNAHGAAYLGSTAVLGAAATLVACYAGFWSGRDSTLATPIFAVYATALVVLSSRLRNVLASWLGSGLLLLALLHGLLHNDVLLDWLREIALAPRDPTVVAALLHAGLVTLAAIVFGWRAGAEKRNDAIDRSLDSVTGEAPPTSTARAGDDAQVLQTTVTSPLTLSALLTSTAVLPIAVIVRDGTFAAHGGYLLWTAVVWGIVAFLRGAPALFAGAQTVATLGLSYGVVAICRVQPWWSGMYLDPRHVQAQLAMLAVWSAAWMVVRGSQHSPLRGLMRAETRELTFDRLLLGLAVFGVVALSLAATLPGIAAELAPVGRAAVLPYQSAASSIVLVASVLLSLAACGIGLWAVLQRGITAAALAGVALTTAVTAIILFAGGRDPSLHVHAAGPGSWIVLGLVLLGIMLSLSERITPTALTGLTLSLAAVPMLIAGRMEPYGAAASTLRWGLAGYGVLIAAAVWGRDRLPQIIRRAGSAGVETDTEDLVGAVRNLAACIALGPIVVLTLWFLNVEFGGWLPREPDSGVLFARLRPVWSYTGPLALLALTFVVFAVRDRLGVFALGGSFLTQLAVCAAVAVSKWSTATALTLVDLAALVVWSMVAAGVYSLGWIAVRRGLDRRSPAGGTREAALTPLDVQLALTAGLAAVPVLWTAIAAVPYPGDLPSAIRVFGSPAAYVGLFLAAAACAWHVRSGGPRSLVDAAFAGSAALVTLIAATSAHWNSAENWLTFHTLACGLCFVTGAGTIAACRLTYIEGGGNTTWLSSLLPRIVGWSVVTGAATLALAVRSLAGDPERPWWAVGGASVLAVLAAALALRAGSQRFAYLSVLLAMAGAGFARLTPWLGLGEQATPQSVAGLIEAVVTAGSLSSLGWLLVDVVWQRRWDRSFDTRTTLPPVHHVISVSGLLAAGGLVAVSLATQTAAISRGQPAPIDVSHPAGWVMLGSLAVLLVGTLWDRAARHVVPALYVWGLVVLAAVIQHVEPTPRMLWFFIGLAAASHALVTGVLSAQSTILRRVGARRGMTARATAGAHGWLTAVNLLVAAAVTLIELRVVLTFPELPLRLWGATAAALLVPAVACLARGVQRVPLRTLALLFAAVAAVDSGWALMPPLAQPSDWLPRAIRLMEALAATAFVYGVGLVRIAPRAGDWFRAARNAATLVGAAALASLVGVLVLEGVWFDARAGAPVTGFQIAEVAIVLVGLAAALISLAALPGRDPLNLSESGRMVYVYAAEAVLSLLFVHIRLTMPELFRGYLLPYWPFIVMVIAFVGIGVGEMLAKLRMNVLSEPLRRTGIFLPLLPAIGYWVHVEQMGRASIVGEYSTVLFFIGLLYIVLAMWRQSFLYGALAGLAGNGALWALLHEHGFEILAHPQMWLIPPAVSVLGAAQINRDRLSEAQLTAIRYLAVTVIYVSSTGEMFLQGVGESLWLPMVLAALSVLGVFAGILMRVRAFLYLGASFLLLSLVSMVWHAARNIGHVWPWWAFGIALGLAILALFGVFEKKRNEVLGVLEEMREWER